jgi:hypothetical protein
MKALIFAICIVFACCSLSAQTQTPIWQRRRVPIWPGAPPDAQPVAGPEVAKTTGREFLVAGRLGVSNVSRPTMTVYSPNGKNAALRLSSFLAGAFRNWLSTWTARRFATG